VLGLLDILDMVHFFPDNFLTINNVHFFISFFMIISEIVVEISYVTLGFYSSNEPFLAVPLLGGETSLPKDCQKCCFPNKCEHPAAAWGDVCALA
jgi:hypothetical protein